MEKNRAAGQFEQFEPESSSKMLLSRADRQTIVWTHKYHKYLYANILESFNEMTLCCTSDSSRGKRTTFLNTSSGSSTASRSQPVTKID